MFLISPRLTVVTLKINTAIPLEFFKKLSCFGYKISLIQVHHQRRTIQILVQLPYHRKVHFWNCNTIRDTDRYELLIHIILTLQLRTRIRHRL